MHSPPMRNNDALDRVHSSPFKKVVTSNLLLTRQSKSKQANKQLHT